MNRSSLNRASVALATLLALTLLIAACGEDDDENVADGSDEQAEATDEGAGDEEWPTRDIRWIVVFDPGGGSDADYRRMQPHLEEQFGVRVDVEYVTGAGGAVGWAECQAAEPDGYTVCGTYMDSNAVQPLTGDVGYEFEGFDWISWHSYAPQILFVNAKDPTFESFEEFEQHVMENPGTVDLGSAEDFGASHAIQAALYDMGLETNHVGAGGGAADVVSGVLGGHMHAGLTSAQQAVGSEDVMPLAVFSEEPYEPLPGVPTAKELGYDVAAASSWGLGAPAGVPDDVKEKWWEAIQYALETDDVQQAIEDDGQRFLGLGLDDAEDYAQELHSFASETLPLMEETVD